MLDPARSFERHALLSCICAVAGHSCSIAWHKVSYERTLEVQSTDVLLAKADASLPCTWPRFF